MAFLNVSIDCVKSVQEIHVANSIRPMEKPHCHIIFHITKQVEDKPGQLNSDGIIELLLYLSCYHCVIYYMIAIFKYTTFFIFYRMDQFFYILLILNRCSCVFFFNWLQFRLESHWGLQRKMLVHKKKTAARTLPATNNTVKTAAMIFLLTAWKHVV